MTERTVMASWFHERMKDAVVSGVEQVEEMSRRRG